MNIIERVKISGFWGEREFNLSLHSDVNFLIGVNGTGKTTAINLIAAALNADFRTLDRIQFEKIDIQLAAVNGSRKPSIYISKEAIKGLPFSNISYLIKDKASEGGTLYSLDTIEGQLSFRELPARYAREYRNQFLQPVPGVTEHLRKLINVSWLSVHRSERFRPNSDERAYTSTIDQKLDNLSNEFVKFFSLLTRRATSETEKFQKMIFLSLITKEDDNKLFASVTELNLQREQDSLIEIFREFRIQAKDYTQQVSIYFDTVKSALKELQTDRNLNSSQILALLNASRIHYVVQKWGDLINIQNKIYEPRDIFLEVINSMLKYKRLEINDRNELIATIIKSEKQIPLQQLSSGEKQLIIVLGEALLQQKESWIYIADEPELSLHVKWQEVLIENIRKINPKAQILFATHSPDIVGVYGNRVFDMEKVLD